MSASNPINLVFVIVFVLIGLFMVLIGASVLAAGPTNDTEWTIGLFSLGAAAALFYGAWQTFKGHRLRNQAEAKEARRLAQKLSNQTSKTVDTVLKEKAFAAQKASEQLSTSAEGDSAPKILACWTYPRNKWQAVLKKLTEKTRKEEFYTAFWFPVFFAIIFWSVWYIGFAIGILAGFGYVKFREYYVRKNYALKPGKLEAEVIITDAYLRINGNFIHYGDGRYFLKNLYQEKDSKLGNLLHFEIGWFTSKGLPAQMDLYLPIADGKEEDAQLILEEFNNRKRG